MMCKHSKAHVEKACMGVAGTVSDEVDLTDKNVTVIGTASKEALTAAITEAGYDVVD
jgi:copper chaperone